jgi:ribosomal protein L37AE/L43A
MKCIYCGSDRINKNKKEGIYECKKCEESFDEDDVKQQMFENGKKDKNKKKFTGNY